MRSDTPSLGLTQQQQPTPPLVTSRCWCGGQDRSKRHPPCTTTARESRERDKRGHGLSVTSRWLVEFFDAGRVSGCSGRCTVVECDEAPPQTVWILPLVHDSSGVILCQKRTVRFTHRAPEQVRWAQLTNFMEYCSTRIGRPFVDQESFHEFSVDNFPEFWSNFIGWANIIYEGSPEPASVGTSAESAQFFPNVRLNYVENLLRVDRDHDESPAVVVYDPELRRVQLTRRELRHRVIATALKFKGLGLQPGDRVAAISVNSGNLVVASLAAMAIGTVLSTVSPDMGIATVLSRLERLSPSALLLGLGDASPNQVDRLERTRRTVDGHAHPHEP